MSDKDSAMKAVENAIKQIESLEAHYHGVVSFRYLENYRLGLTAILVALTEVKP